MIQALILSCVFEGKEMDENRLRYGVLNVHSGYLAYTN